MNLEEMHALIGQIVIAMQCMNDNQISAFINVIEIVFREHKEKLNVGATGPSILSTH